MRTTRRTGRGRRARRRGVKTEERLAGSPVRAARGGTWCSSAAGLVRLRLSSDGRSRRLGGEGGMGPIDAGGEGRWAGAGGGAAAEWVEQHDADGRYRIKFPSAPRTQNVTQQPRPARSPSRSTWRGTRPRRSSAPTSSSPPIAGVSDDQILDQAIVAAKVQAQGASAGPTRSMTYQSLPGREVAMTFPGKKGEMVIRVDLAGDRVLALRPWATMPRPTPRGSSGSLSR